MARRCRICDSTYTITNSLGSFVANDEDICPSCEVVIVETVEEMEEQDEWDE